MDEIPVTQKIERYVINKVESMEVFQWMVEHDLVVEDQLYYIPGEGFVLLPATASTLGGIKVGSRLSVTADGTLSVNIPNATDSVDGIMTAAQAKKLAGIADGANKYTHPTYTNRASGLYKITVDSSGHVSAVTAVTKADITGLGIPAQDTVYKHPTYTARTAGLNKVTVDGTGHVSAVTPMTKEDVVALGIPAQDTVYTHPTDAGNKHIPTGGSVGQILENSASGTAKWVNKPVIDTAMSTTSTNAVQNKVVNAAIKAVSDKVSAMLLNADTAFDTFKEISDWVSTHNTEYEALKSLSNNKVDKVTGKGLSTNDFTTALLNKLNGIADGANKYVHPTHTAKTSGLYKIVVDSLGHVTGTTAATKADVGLDKVDNTADKDKVVGTANKLSTVRYIGGSPFDGTQNVNVYESYLFWNGRNLAGSLSPLDTALNDDGRANRIAAIKAENISVEYSQDGGETWIDYGLSDSEKKKLVTTQGSATIGKAQLPITVNYKVRVTIEARGFYFTCKKLMVFLNTNGATGATCTIQKSTIGSPDVFDSGTEFNVSGWSGWNSIPLETNFGGNNNQLTNTRKVRLVFGITGLSASYTNSLNILKIRMYGPNSYSYSHHIQVDGHAYSYDEDVNVTFPAKVKAVSFEGATATETANGLMSSSDKKALANKADIGHKHTYEDVGAVKNDSVYKLGLVFSDETQNFGVKNMESGAVQNLVPLGEDGKIPSNYLPSTGGNFDFDTYSNMTGYTYSYDKATKTETLTQGTNTFATRENVKNADGSWTITITCASMNFTSKKTWVKDANGNWSTTDVGGGGLT